MAAELLGSRPCRRTRPTLANPSSMTGNSLQHPKKKTEAARRVSLAGCGCSALFKYDNGAVEASGDTPLCCTDQQPSAQPPASTLLRGERTAVAHAPACGSARRQQWPPRSSAAFAPRLQGVTDHALVVCFRTPALSRAGWVTTGRHPKPFTESGRSLPPATRTLMPGNIHGGKVSRVGLDSGCS